MEFQGKRMKNRFWISDSQTLHPKIVINKESFCNVCFNKMSHQRYVVTTQSMEAEQTEY